MAVKKDSLDEIKMVMLQTAKGMLEANQCPSSELQVNIINSANELVKTVLAIDSTARA